MEKELSGTKIIEFSAFVLIIFQFYFQQLLSFLLTLFKSTRQQISIFLVSCVDVMVSFWGFPQQKDTFLSPFPPLILILSIVIPSWTLRLAFWVSSECWMASAQHGCSVSGWCTRVCTPGMALDTVGGTSALALLSRCLYACVLDRLRGVWDMSNASKWLLLQSCWSRRGLIILRSTHPAIYKVLIYKIM